MEHFNKNGIDILFENKKDTPRTSVCMYFKINKPENFSGTYALLAKLLLQGTTSKDAETLAKEFEDNCIDVSVKVKQDYVKASFLFLNEDFEHSMELARDILLNSTFNDFEKEVFKLKNEIISDLDSPRLKVSDGFVRAIFKNHYYANTHTKMLEDLDKISVNDVKDFLGQILNAQKVVSVVGDIDKDFVLGYFEKNFDFMKSIEQKNEIEDVFELKTDDNIIVKTAKDDLNQAQIIQGWLTVSLNDPDYYKISVMNNILGGAGLSSRLFVELRDKQGLAYNVRSTFEPLYHSGIFSIYIGTEPKNIEKSLNGFTFEISRLKNLDFTEVELQGAKENILGRVEYFSQTNSQIASYEGYNYLTGLGVNYKAKFTNLINAVTREDVAYAAERILNSKNVVSILAPKSFL